MNRLFRRTQKPTPQIKVARHKILKKALKRYLSQSAQQFRHETPMQRKLAQRKQRILHITSKRYNTTNKEYDTKCSQAFLQTHKLFRS